LIVGGVLGVGERRAGDAHPPASRCLSLSPPSEVNNNTRSTTIAKPTWLANAWVSAWSWTLPSSSDLRVATRDSSEDFFCSMPFSDASISLAFSTGLGPPSAPICFMTSATWETLSLSELRALCLPSAPVSKDFWSWRTSKKGRDASEREGERGGEIEGESQQWW